MSGPVRVLAVSPHLDDAVLSCGGWLATLPASSHVTVTTLFTAAAPPPHTRVARALVRQAGGTDAAELYAARREEDLEALAALAASGGIEVQVDHAGFVDALFRERARRLPLPAAVHRALPELSHLYPTYQWDVAVGRVARADRSLRAQLARHVRALVDRLAPGVVLAPLGVGRHVDHLLTRDATTEALTGFGGKALLGYYSDQPYALEQSPDGGFVARLDLRPTPFTPPPVKADLVARYASQIAPLFPTGIPELPECFWFPTHLPAVVTAGERWERRA